MMRHSVWSPEGLRVVSSSYDKTLRMWDAATGQCLYTIAPFPNGEWAVLDPATGFRHASPGAWQHLAWRWMREGDFPRVLPAEFFGPLPG